ncbi:MAG: FtsW/RodA/SpoVE family cell cycle protein [Eubacteriales bacterium]
MTEGKMVGDAARKSGARPFGEAKSSKSHNTGRAAGGKAPGERKEKAKKKESARRGTPRRVIANRRDASKAPAALSNSMETGAAGVASKTAVPAAGVRAQKARSGHVSPEDIIRLRGGVDRPMLLIIILLLCFGSIMVFSSSFPNALNDYGDSYYYIKRQLGFIVIGSVGMIAAAIIDYRWIRRVTTAIYIVALILLVAVLFTGYGSSSGMAKRWLEIPGLIRFQPSELMKLALVLMIAKYMSDHEAEITDYSNFRRSSWHGFFVPFIFTVVACLLVALEFHFSGTIILFLIGMIVIFAGGARMFWFFLGGGLAAAVLIPAILFTDYAKLRIDTWLHPENYAANNEIWQTLQGLNAVGSGGLFGVGLGYSRQKHLFVPEPQNDFIFSIVCEELGFIGALAVILLFALFVWRGIVIALRAPDTFTSLVVIGIVGKIAIQATLNMMVVTNLIPNTGISLPFFSYGGTSLAMLMGEMGIVLCISRYSYQEK